MKLPDRIARLDELANNLWWSWHPKARDLFRTLDYPLWRAEGHNPVKQLRSIDPDLMFNAARDPVFLNLYDSVISDFDADMSARDLWFVNNNPGSLTGPIAYFSMEFAIHNSLPIYAGGLGILAGDTCKEASDMGLPFIGIGFMYPQGYFHQHISADGWQEEIYQQLDFDSTPINPVVSNNGDRILAQVELDNRLVSIGVWQIQVGCTTIYLLDTDLKENIPQDRQLTARLYIADPEIRLQQEIILGVGGVRILGMLGIEPSLWHANEGHAAFMMLERARMECERGTSPVEALRKTKANTVFTTHTPVPAGHDVFPVEIVEKYLGNYLQTYCIKQEAFMRLGQQDSTFDRNFNMTVLAMKMSSYRNAVSLLHGKVTRKMWHALWPNIKGAEVPIVHVTNGIHVPTWVAPEMAHLYEKYLDRDWIKKHDDIGVWERILEIPDDEIWAVRQLLKRKLMGAMRERAQKRWAENGVTDRQVLAMGSLLDQNVLTLGFVRRFTEYKRPALVFRDIERLKRIIQYRWRPVQLIFAGKSHPADMASKDLLHQVYDLAMDRDYRGRITFVEDYDMHMAHYLVQGVDIWLNTPRRLREASGTSGMKAALNGALHLSVPDGWWYEGYNCSNGWIIGNEAEADDPESEDNSDAESLYRLLEEQIIPLYYQRDRSGVPHEWIRLIKESIRSIVPVFSTRRMLKEYTEKLYIPVAKSLLTSDLH